MSYKTIPVRESTKYRLDKVKGNKSYDSIVEEMVNYFEVSGISPTSNIVSPVIVMKEQANRIIEVMRGIEKAQKKEFDTISAKVKNAHFSIATESEEEKKAEEILNDLVKNLEKTTAEKEQLLEKIRGLEKPIDSSSTKIKKDDLIRVRNLAKEFNNSSRFNITGLRNDKYSYDKMFIISTIREMEEKLNEMINTI